jgi:hypothetical protein
MSTDTRTPQPQPAGWVACLGTCGRTGQVRAEVLEQDWAAVEAGAEAEVEVSTCEDCDGRGWVAPMTSADRAEARDADIAVRLHREAEHAAEYHGAGQPVDGYCRPAVCTRRRAGEVPVR